MPVLRSLRALMIAVCVAAAAPSFADKPRDLPLEPQSIEVTARPIAAFRLGEPERRRFGQLEWIGGLELSSRFAGFGGLSGLAFTEPGGRRLLAVSDAGIWLAAELVTDGERPTGIRNARMSPMRDERGRSVAGTWRGDAEAIAIRGNEVFVAFEGINEIRRYTIGQDVLTANGISIPVPPTVKDLRRSRGLEALTLFPERTRHAGAFLAIGESPLRGEDWNRAWILGGPALGQFRLVHKDDFHVTDAAILPSGDVLVLERRVNVPFGIWARIRRIAATQIQAGATVDGPVIFQADLGHVIDNMEGIALHTGADGATYVTLVSDDNYSLLQRTLLLRFRLVE